MLSTCHQAKKDLCKPGGAGVSLSPHPTDSFTSDRSRHIELLEQSLSTNSNGYHSGFQP